MAPRGYVRGTAVAALLGCAAAGLSFLAGLNLTAAGVWAVVAIPFVAVLTRR